MIEHFKNIFRRIFSNEETVIFFLIILSTLILFSLFIEVLTPFIISIVVAYLLVGLQKKIETYGVTQPVSTSIAFSFGFWIKGFLLQALNKCQQHVAMMNIMNLSTALPSIDSDLLFSRVILSAKITIKPKQMMKTN